ncbi:MAG: hypothetical protein HZC28_04030 [Spirochaetes bacterium]|nr:hypothetical protein [Spirochaetota bacterium]
MKRALRFSGIILLLLSLWVSIIYIADIAGGARYYYFWFTIQLILSGIALTLLAESRTERA